MDVFKARKIITEVLTENPSASISHMRKAGLQGGQAQIHNLVRTIKSELGLSSLTSPPPIPLPPRYNKPMEHGVLANPPPDEPDPDEPPKEDREAYAAYARAVRYRTNREIANELGISPADAAEFARRGLKSRQQTVEEMQLAMVYSLEADMRKIEPRVRKGELDAIKVKRQHMEFIARIFGLEMSAQVAQARLVQQAITQLSLAYEEAAKDLAPDRADRIRAAARSNFAAAVGATTPMPADPVTVA